MSSPVPLSAYLAIGVHCRTVQMSRTTATTFGSADFPAVQDAAGRVIPRDIRTFSTGFDRTLRVPRSAAVVVARRGLLAANRSTLGPALRTQALLVLSA